MAGLVLLLAAALMPRPAAAQIVDRSARDVERENRRAQREARRTDAPYKDTHLDVSREQESPEALKKQRTENPDVLRYKSGLAPNAGQRNFLGLPRKKTLRYDSKPPRGKKSPSPEKPKK